MIRRALLVAACLAAPALAQQNPTVDGAAIYQQSCVGCHGVGARGASAKSMVDGDWQFGSRRQDLFRNTKFGIERAGMPKYEGGLSDAQINAVIDHILKLERSAHNDAPPKRTLPTELKTRDYAIDVAKFAEGLDEPWAITFLSPTHALITEKGGPVRQVVDGKLLPEPIRGTPRTQVMGQGGMMDVAIDPDYAANGWVYLSYSHPRGGVFERDTPCMTRLVRGKIVDNAWTDEQLLFEAKPEHYRVAGAHFGCRIVFDGAGHLFFSIGERGAQDHAQDLSRPNGKVHRIHTDGRIPQDNPFVGKPNVYESIWSYGNRNPQGLAWIAPRKELWATEHGPLGGDELNRIAAGKNYGWPIATYGRNYNGTVISNDRELPGVEPPVVQWTPSPAMCGLDVYTGDAFAKWKGNLFAGALKMEEVKRLVLDESGKVVDEEVILKNAGRVRDVQVGPDGSIYVVLNAPGTVLKLTPRR